MDSIIWTLYKKRAVKTIVDSSFLYKEKKMSDEASVLKIKWKKKFFEPPNESVNSERKT